MLNVIMLNVVMLTVIKLNVVMLSVIIMSVVAPCNVLIFLFVTHPDRISCRVYSKQYFQTFIRVRCSTLAYLGQKLSTNATRF